MKGNLRAITECAIGSRLRLAADAIDLAPGVKVRFLAPNDVAFELTDPAEKAFVATLIDAAPNRISFSASVEKANAMVREQGLPQCADSVLLCRMLYQLFILDAVDLMLAGSSGWLREGTVPSPLMRLQSAEGREATNRWHEPVALTGDARRVIAAPTSAEDFAGLAIAGLLA